MKNLYVALLLLVGKQQNMFKPNIKMGEEIPALLESNQLTYWSIKLGVVAALIMSIDSYGWQYKTYYFDMFLLKLFLEVAEI